MANQFVAPEVQPFFELAQEINRRCLAERVDTVGLAQFILTAASRLGNVVPEDAIMTWQESFDYFNNLMEKRREIAALPESERRVMRWPWETWNVYLDPPGPGVMHVISAPDGSGKTVAAESIAEAWAEQGFNVVFLHYELNKAIMTDRRASRNTGVTRRELLTVDLTEQQRSRIERMERRMRGYPGEVTYIHSPGWTPERTTQVLHTLHAEGRCDVFIVDYLEKVAASDSQLRRFGSNANGREADTVEQFKNFAELHQIPAVMLAQFSKAGKTTRFEHLNRTDIRGAGEKTEKANVVVLLFREMDEDGSYSNLIKVKIDKNTLGPTGSFEQYFDGAHFRIADSVNPDEIENDATLLQSTIEI